METGRLGLGAVTLMAVLCGAGCKRNPDTATAEPKTADGYEVVAVPDAVKPKDFDKLQQAAQERTITRQPTSPDPEGGEFTLDEAVAGLAGQGPLVAEIVTDLGTMFCDLESNLAPITVANFVGLARGKRPFWDARAATWTTRPFYDGSSFHRVIPGFMIQGGDALGDGSGGVGYEFEDEHPKGLKHDRAGLLCMANHGANTNGGQFFITDAAAPHLDMGGTYTIFGQCVQTDVVSRIARVPQEGEPNNRPITTVNIKQVIISRVAGGAEKAKHTPPTAPPASAPELQRQFRGAGQSPSELQGVGQPATH